MGEYSEAFVGIDVAKGRNAIAIADGERGGEVRYLGEVDASPASMTRIVRRLAEKYDRVQFCYEAGPTGYGLYRLVTALGHDCAVVAPSLIPRRPGERVKTNRRDAVALAKLLRAGELTAVWVPDEGHEAMRDLVRARSAAVETLRVHKQQVSAFMLKHGRHYPRKKAWSMRYLRGASDCLAGDGGSGPPRQGAGRAVGAHDRGVSAGLVAGPDRRCTTGLARRRPDRRGHLRERGR